MSGSRFKAEPMPRNADTDPIRVAAKPTSSFRASAQAEEQQAEQVGQQFGLGAAPRSAPTRNVPASRGVLQSTLAEGQPLDRAAREILEPHFGHDFSQVRVHADDRAATAAQAQAAQAFTTGSQIVFGPGRYAPASAAGRTLLAHELMHVVQQSATPSQPSVQRKPDPEEVKRVASLKAAYKAAVKAKTPDWKLIAELLNGFSEKDILTRLNEFSADDLKELDQAVLEIMPIPQWPDRIHKHIGPLLIEAERVATLKQAYTAAMAAPNRDWDHIVKLLNGFSNADIMLRLRPLSMEELRQMDAAVLRVMANWPDRIHGPILRLQMAKIDPNDPSGTAERLNSQGDIAPPSAKEMAGKSDDQRTRWQNWLDTRDQTAQNFGAADYQDYVRNMLKGGGAVFGRSVPTQHPVHPLFLERLESASRKAKALIGSNDFGINGFGGQDNRPGNHAWGLAIDIDSSANPYVLNESGEANLDQLIAPVYERIAQALLHRSSVMTAGSKTAMQKATYSEIAEENDAMIAYFSVMPEPPGPAVNSENKPLPTLDAPRKLSNRIFNSADLDKLDRALVQADYNLLVGKQIVEVVGGVPQPRAITKEWRAEKKVSGDFPFAGAGSGYTRDPRRGFLTIREEVVEALRSEKLRWGAIDFVGACGDVMHFDDGSHHADYVAYGKQNPTEKFKQLKQGE